MIQTVEGVEIDTSMFPITHRTYKSVIRIARQYKYPIQDALQECMMLEIVKQEYLSKRTNPKATLEQIMRFKILQYYRRHILCRMDNKNHKDEVLKLAERGLIRPIKGETRIEKKRNIKAEYIQELIDKGLIQGRSGGAVSLNEFTDIPDGMYDGAMIIFTRRDMHNKLFMSEVKEILKGMKQVHRDIVQYKIENPAMSWRSIHKKFFCGQIEKTQFFNRVYEVRNICRQLRVRNKEQYGMLTGGAFKVGIDGFFNDIKVQLQYNLDRDGEHISLACQ